MRKNRKKLKANTQYQGLNQRKREEVDQGSKDGQTRLSISIRQSKNRILVKQIVKRKFDVTKISKIGQI